ncbi:predicted protein [Naegleria gruberi]|uniref:Predicted protein n=1 Tax=Naegleria gruberi TaxID=5762 RepID=D2VIM3_NAEGR|nr:uncharacterized protein NAEGRDRAFT_68728 [Naegleria gruberi]EFC43380.1 predicted protein [Naegleria gruberi]|eukprot:XP_002676124.1 predicted protein [Naegleria gruberi strain NEG-M]
MNQNKSFTLLSVEEVSDDDKQIKITTSTATTSTSQQDQQIALNAEDLSMVFDITWYDYIDPGSNKSLTIHYADIDECNISVDDHCSSSTTKQSSSDISSESRKSSIGSDDLQLSNNSRLRNKNRMDYFHNVRRELLPLIFTCIPFLVFNLCILILGLEDMIVVGHINSNRSGLATLNNTVTQVDFSQPGALTELYGFDYALNINSTSLYPTTSEYLASLTLATSLFNGLSIIVLGLIGNGQEPLISKAFGNKDGNLIIAEWIRSLLLQTLFMIPVSIIMFFSGYIAMLFELVETTPEGLISRQVVTQLTITFMRYLIPGLFPFIYSRSLYSFMVAQKIYWPSIAVCIVCVVYNVLMSFFLVGGVGDFKGIGFYGSAIATSSTRWLMFIGFFILMVFVIICKKEMRQMFKNFSLKEIIYATTSKTGELPQDEKLPTTINVTPFKKEKSLKGIFDHLKISFPGSIMMSSEIWGSELSTFIAGFLGNTQLSVHGIVLSISNFAYLIPMSLSMASTVCIAHRFGRGDYKSVRYSSHANIILSSFIMVITVIVVACTIVVLPKIYTSDSTLIYESIRILPICLIFLIVDGFQAIFGGILRGLNKPFVCAVIGVIGYFVIGFPFGCVLAFVLDWGLLGVWIGFTLSLAIIAILQGSYWLLISKQAKKLAKKNYLAQQLEELKKTSLTASTPYLSTHGLLNKV